MQERINDHSGQGKQRGDQSLAYYENLADLLLMHYEVATVALRLFEPSGAIRATLIKGDDTLFNDNKGLCDDLFKRVDYLQVEDQLENRTLRGAQLLSLSKLRFILGYPVLDEGKFLTSSICLLDTKPRRLEAAKLRFLMTIASLF